MYHESSKSGIDIIICLRSDLFQKMKSSKLRLFGASCLLAFRVLGELPGPNLVYPAAPLMKLESSVANGCVLFPFLT